MNELIELNGAELAASKLGVTVTLYDLAKVYGKNKSKDWHRDLIRAFKKDYNDLPIETKQLVNFSESIIEVHSGKNTIRQLTTLDMDVKTAVWFASRFDAKLRMDVINYAFTKLENDHNKEVKQLESRNTKLNKEIANKMFNETDDGYMSVSKIKRLLDTDLSVSDIFDILEENGDIETKLVTTKKRVLTSFNGIEDEGKSPRFKLDYVTRLIEENE